MSEKLCLKWNDFHDNTSTAFGSLRNDRDLSDVTLACEDGEQIQAHKVILASSSPFFRTILTKNKHQHPLIYMRGMKSEDLVAIIDFLYYGETNVYQENIDSFLVIAEELKLKGLTGNESIEDVEVPTYKPPDKINNRKKSIVPKESKPKQEPIETKTAADDKIGRELSLAVPSYAVSNVDITDVQELDKQVKSMMTKSQNILPNRNKKADICTMCGKEGEGGNIMEHIEANHLDGVSLPCNYCEKTFRCRTYLKKHISRIHNEI